VVGGIAVLAVTTIEKLTVFSAMLWIASPLVLLWLMDAGLAAEQRRCIELLKRNEETSECVQASILDFFRALVSVSVLPFYLALFGLIAFGGKEIAKANREVEAKAAEKAVRYYQQGNMPDMPQRSTILPFNQNPPMQRFTPSPFGTPPRFMGTHRPVVTPPKLMVTPTALPGSPPVKVQ